MIPASQHPGPLGSLRLIHVADQFLRERKAEQGNWWNTNEGKAKMARVKEEFGMANPPSTKDDLEI